MKKTIAYKKKRVLILELEVGVVYPGKHDTWEFYPQGRFIGKTEWHLSLNKSSLLSS